MRSIQNKLSITIKNRLFEMHNFAFVFFTVLLIMLTIASATAYSQQDLKYPPTIISVRAFTDKSCEIVWDAPIAVESTALSVDGYSVSRITGLMGQGNREYFGYYLNKQSTKGSIGQKGLKDYFPCDPKQLTSWSMSSSNTNGHTSKSSNYFTLTPPDVPINLKSAVNGRFLKIDPNRYNCMMAHSTVADTGEKFWLVTNADGYISLRAEVNKKYVTVQQTNGQLQALVTSIVKDDDKFMLIKNSDGTVSLQSGYNAKWISTDLTQGAYVLANAKSGNVADITTAEKFNIIILPK